MQDKLKENLGQAVVVENKPQAGGTVGTNEVAKSAPDGYTWVMSYNGPLAFGPHLYPKLPYQPEKDLIAVITTTSQPNVIAANVQLPANSIRELITLLKQEPGKYNFASVGNGSSSHLTMEYIKSVSNTFAVHIPFNGSPPAVMSTLSGETQLIASVPTVISPQVRQGKLKYLAVTSAQRNPLYPDVPTVAELGYPGFEALSWSGLSVPKGTPQVIVDKLESAMKQVMSQPAIRQRMDSQGFVIPPQGIKPYTEFVASEMDRWTKVIRTGKIRIE
jgi:tripartite-type tricarboxylate transporter receptor subunit TctC